ncbi:hypothetical protein K466DRAFT_665515 [Polyporus arcularius HHB13444]|uniref:Uncharacterized protein n=1 Tax=Polyporus arcularius HHB13444 TaxID=1314778 RepID=A0A5C3P5R3_9APHY|nr:hypothetical protein K466DRAFT_665515 [Polyporus arcularius HHB13444]
MPGSAPQLSSSRRHRQLPGPSASTYAAIRIHPVDSVAAYDYPDIQEAARKISTKTYLVYLRLRLNLPTADDEWHPFEVVPIAPCLRPASERRGATPDMCTPIYPNTAHPSGHSSCKMDVRIQTRAEQFNNDAAFKLPPHSRVKLWDFMNQDLARMAQTRELHVTLGRAPSTHSSDGSEEQAGLDYDDVPEEESEEGATEDFASNEEGGRNDSVVFPTGNILQDLFKAGLLGNYESRHDLLPLVDLWFDLPEAIKQEDIPVPVDLFAERDANLNLPIPGRPWYAFDIVLIPTSLPPPDATRAATADMCMPIFPNTYHPEGRQPLQTEGTFPYDTCYHWSDDSLRMDVRVRARAEQFDDDIAIKLTADSRMKLRQYMGQDFACMQQMRAAQRSHSDPRVAHALAELPRTDSLKESPVAGDQADTVMSSREPSLARMDVATEHDTSRETDAASTVVSDRDVPSDHESVTLGEVIQDVLNAGIFGSFGDDQEVYPLVDLWLDLPATLKQEDIPDYKDLFKERDAVVELIMEGRRRHKEEAARRVREQEPAGMLEPPAEAQTVAQQERCRHGGLCPGRVLRGVRTGMRRIRAHISHLFRLPYMSVWP